MCGQTLYLSLRLPRRQKVGDYGVPPQTNGQTERYNKTIVERLLHYVAEHQGCWYLYVPPLIYAYNTHVHLSTNFSPFRFVLSRQPLGPATTVYPTDFPTDVTTYMPDDKMRLQLMSRLETMKAKTGTTLTKSKRRYKKYFYRAVRYVPNITLCMQVFIDKPPPSAKTQPELLSNQPRSKLQHKTTGPFKVLASTSDTVTIREEGIPNTVSKDLATVVPSGNGKWTGNPGNPKSLDNKDAGSDSKTTQMPMPKRTQVKVTPLETAEYVVDYIVNNLEEDLVNSLFTCLLYHNESFQHRVA